MQYGQLGVYPKRYMNGQAQLGDIWSDLRDKFNLPKTEEAIQILKKDGVQGLQSAVASGVISSDTAQALAAEVTKKQGTAALAEALRNNWKQYLMIGGGVVVGAGILFFLVGRGSK